jgi:hypothetical protein
VIGESAGNASLKKAFINFSDLSRQYFALTNTEPVGSLILKDAEKITATAKDEVIKACSDYAVR